MNMRCDRSFFISLLSGLAFYAAAILLGCPSLLADETGVMTVQTAEGKLYTQPVKIAPVMETLEKGAKVLALHQKGEWYAVSLPDQRLGWAHQSIFTLEETTAETETTLEAETPEASAPAQAGQNAVLKVHSGRVRKAPSLDARLAFGLTQGDRFTVLGTQGDWYHIKAASGQTGWIYHTLVKFLSPPPSSETEAPDVRDESAPPKAEDAIAAADSAPPETEKAAAETDGGFTVTVKVRSGRVRTGPSIASPTAFVIRQGTRAKVTETEGSWYRILLPDGRTGWSYNTLFDIVGEKDASAPKTQKSAEIVTPVPTAEEKTEKKKTEEKPKAARKKETSTAEAETPAVKEIKTIRFETTPEGDETIIFELSSFNPPKTYTMDDKNVPMVVCEFADTRLSPSIGKTVPANGKLVTALSIRQPGGGDSPIRVEASLDPQFKYSVDQVFFKKTNLYIITFKK